ncbi:T-cell surface glycoprotein CD3 epsilon chain-like [Fundulus heteroclitus]|uniref:T-cell surface glycoprotein CD3 epsilon chain-like n=1 Tax=Fundulus heteroclitus TaxID=8078 RepID=UPI00165AFBCB|nr:T-cell surface glycoprotein CD3 epsilon chain-like [Fundulus heteroclitus]
MPHIGVQAAVVVLLTLATAVKTETGEVTFWNKDVAIKCPKHSTVHAKDGTKIHDGNEYMFEYKQEVQYECKDAEEKKTYSFYIKGRVCENCFELSGNFFLVIIMADLFGSVVVMALIYKCSKKKSSDGPSKPTKATPKTGGRAPPVPSPDYESLNVHTLSSDTYSTMNTGMVNRMG